MSRLKCSLSAPASPLSLSDDEIDLDVSFSQKIPVGFLPHETAPDKLTFFSPSRQMTGPPHTERSDERYARFSCRASLGVMIDGANSSQSRQMRKQGMWKVGEVRAITNPIVRRRRSAVLSSAAKELEFSVHSMSTSQAGYATRSKSAVDSVRRLARDDAWTSERGDGRMAHEDEWDVVALLRRACLRVEVDNDNDERE
jgi:hypothetical protein